MQSPSLNNIFLLKCPLHTNRKYVSEIGEPKRMQIRTNKSLHEPLRMTFFYII